MRNIFMINSIAVIVLVYCLKGICTINMILSEKMHFPINILPLGFILEKIHHMQRGILSAPFSSSFGSNYLLPTQQLVAYTYQCKEEEIWAWGGGKVSQRRRKNELTKMPLCLWWRIFKNECLRPYLQYQMHLLRSYHIYGAYSL